MGQLILITGGARSGKSAFAESLALEAATGGPVGYVATSRVLDGEMRERVRLHQERRGPQWRIVEEPLAPGAAIARKMGTGAPKIWLLDCITALIANIILDAELDWEKSPDEKTVAPVRAQIEAEIAAIADAAASDQVEQLIAVTNEVGFGIVPPSPLARYFRDCSGWASQTLAAKAEAVYMVVAGQPLCLKGGKE